MKRIIFSMLLLATPVFADEQCLQEKIQIQALLQTNAQLQANSAQLQYNQAQVEKQRLETVQKAEQPAKTPTPTDPPAEAPK